MRKYELVERTPSSMRYGIGAMCPAVYKVVERTPDALKCGIGACVGVYEDSGKGIYLIIGDRVKPEDAGLENKVGKNEVLIKVPRELIDKIKRTG